MHYLVDLFRELREAWFNEVLRSNPHPREWESEEAEEYRNENNRKLKKQYDEQTELLICQYGCKHLVSPRSSHELDLTRKEKDK